MGNQKKRLKFCTTTFTQPFKQQQNIAQSHFVLPIVIPNPLGIAIELFTTTVVMAHNFSKQRVMAKRLNALACLCCW
jgi:hypothetical protein